jgi:hypothetical protein
MPFCAAVASRRCHCIGETQRSWTTGSLHRSSAFSVSTHRAGSRVRPSKPERARPGAPAVRFTSSAEQASGQTFGQTMVRSPELASRGRSSRAALTCDDFAFPAAGKDRRNRVGSIASKPARKGAHFPWVPLQLPSARCQKLGRNRGDRFILF